MRLGKAVSAATVILTCVSILLAQDRNAELVARERYFYDQLKAKNLEALPGIFDEDFNGVFAGGILTKNDEVEGFQAAVLEDYTFSNITVRFLSEDVGIIIYKAWIRGSYKGKDITGESYHTSTYVRKGGKWLMTLHTEAAAPARESKQLNENFIGLATLAYYVPDLGKAKAWYSKAFGVEPYFDEPFYVGFDINGYELGLLPAEGERLPGNASVTYWAVRDISESYSRLLELGASEVEKPTDVGGGLMVATLKDPWDNRIGIIYNPNFKK